MPSRQLSAPAAPTLAASPSGHRQRREAVEHLSCSASTPPPGTGRAGSATDAVPILVVDDDPRELSRILRTEQPRLVLLDLMLPGTDGIQLMQTVPELADLPVIFISGYGRDETIARALEAGADDYIVKPFSPTELTARIRAALRRRAAPVPFALGPLAIDYDQRRVTVAGSPVELTATAYELLRVLAQDAGWVLTHETLLGRAPRRRSQDRARLRQAAARQARRRGRPPGPDRQRARGGLPHAPARRPVAPRPSGLGRSSRRRSRVSETVRDARHTHACVAGML